MRLNDSTWNADNIQYLSLGATYGAARYVSFSASRGSDTIEIVGLGQQGATWAFANPLCVLRVRRAWGVYQDSAGKHALRDSLACSTFSPNLVAGQITAGSPLGRAGATRDSVRVSCTFSLSY